MIVVDAGNTFAGYAKPREDINSLSGAGHCHYLLQEGAPSESLFA